MHRSSIAVLVRVLTIAFASATVDDDAVGGAEQIVWHLDQGIVNARHDSLVVAASDSRFMGRLFGTACIPEEVADDCYLFRYWSSGEDTTGSGCHCSSRSGPINTAQVCAASTTIGKN